jgi:hypothetical protein
LSTKYRRYLVFPQKQFFASGSLRGVEKVAKFVNSSSTLSGDKKLRPLLSVCLADNSGKVSARAGAGH